MGSTIAELQSKLTENELLVWMRYRKKFGPLGPVRMYDQPAALIAAQINNAFGGKARPLDFMPYGQKEEAPEDVIVDTEEFLSALVKLAGSKVRYGRR